MSASPQLVVVAGIRLDPEQLRESFGMAWVCSNGHPREQDHWYSCPLDGCRFEHREVFRPSPLFQRLLAWAGGNVDRLSCAMDESTGLHDLAGSGPDAPCVFGVSPRRRLEDLRDDIPNAYLYVLSPAEITALVEEATALCRQLYVPGTVQLHVCGSISW